MFTVQSGCWAHDGLEPAEAERCSRQLRSATPRVPLLQCSRKLDRAVVTQDGRTECPAKGNELKDMLALDGLGSDHRDDLEAPRSAPLPQAVRQHLGRQLQAAYSSLITTQLPQRLLDLIAQLDGVLAGEDGISRADFRRGLIEMLPGLRAFAMSLVSNQTRADDLVQETLLKAWAKQEQFVAGTNLKAWLCTILRNQLYTETRKRKREVEDADGAMAAQMIAPAAQEHGSDLRVVWQHLGRLPALQREALLLVGAQGLTYEAAAEVMGCEVGTVKSPVSRARALLAERLGMGTERALA
jgi:RNA polymerase sigma factor (sigma-70 family)